VFGAFNNTCVSQQYLCLWNDDLANLDNFTLSGAVSGDSVIKSSPGSYMSRNHNGLERVPHQYMVAPTITLTGVTRTQMDSRLVPFRMPAFWMFSETAIGVVEYEVLIPTAETVLFEINGEAVGVGQQFASLSLTTSGFNRWLIRFEITGPRTSGGLTTGRFIATAIGGGANQTVASFGETSDLTQVAMAYASVNPLVTRLYVTRSVGTGDMQFLRMNSWVAT
jgi:hypothetical protein